MVRGVHAGLITLLAAKAYGADTIAVTDVKEDNLSLADTLGANVALLQQPHATTAQVAEALRTALPPFGPDIIIDCAGFESTMQVPPPPPPPPPPPTRTHARKWSLESIPPSHSLTHPFSLLVMRSQSPQDKDMWIAAQLLRQ